MTITDDERREAARKLREIELMRLPDSDSEMEAIHEAVGCWFGQPHFDQEVTDRLADLIEPSERACYYYDSETNHCGCYDTRLVDRERLLAIATMMAADSVRSVKKGDSVSPVYILHAARNIAEACGETFGSIRDRELAEWGTSIVPKETIVDRDALLALADRMEGYARFCKERSIQVGINIVECYALLIREAVDACEARPDAPAAGDEVQTDTDAHADGNEAADGARATSMDVLRWVKDHGGLDEVKRRVWASNELRDKLRSRERKIERLKKALGYADAKNAERRDGAKFIRKHGGLGNVRRMTQAGMDRRIELCGALGMPVYTEWSEAIAKLRKRLMPEGMEWLLDVWPKWSNGEYCKFGDWWTADKYGDYEPRQLRRLIFYTPEQLREWEQDEGDNFGYEWDFMRPSDTTYRPDKAEPPAPKVLAADGAECHVGDHGYWLDQPGIEVIIKRIDSREMSQLTVYDTHGRGNTIGADEFTHERPDSWERLEEDAMQLDIDLNDTTDDYPRMSCCRDLVRRAKKLAERGQ